MFFCNLAQCGHWEASFLSYIASWTTEYWQWIHPVNSSAHAWILHALPAPLKFLLVMWKQFPQWQSPKNTSYKDRLMTWGMLTLQYGLQDWVDIDFGISEGVDFIAVSFVKSPEVIKHLKSYVKARAPDRYSIFMLSYDPAYVHKDELAALGHPEQYALFGLQVHSFESWHM